MASFKIHGIRSPIRFVNNIYKMLPVKASLCFLKYLDNENNSLIFYLKSQNLIKKPTAILKISEMLIIIITG